MNSTIWVTALLNGVGFGLLLTIMLGPVFFALLQTSLHEGFRAGMFLAFGVFLSDTVFIMVCYSFASLIRLIDDHHQAMGILGGILMIGFGIYNFFHRVKMKEVDDGKKTVHAHFVLKGFLLNLFNPAVFFFWLSIIGLVDSKEEYSSFDEGIFFSATLFTVFTTDIIKSFIAHRIKDFLKPNVMLWINRIIGVVLIGFGINMILG